MPTLVEAIRRFLSPHTTSKKLMDSGKSVIVLEGEGSLANEAGVKIDSAKVEKQTLEDVFIRLTRR